MDSFGIIATLTSSSQADISVGIDKDLKAHTHRFDSVPIGYPTQSYLQIHQVSDFLIIEGEDTFKDDHIGTVDRSRLFFTGMFGEVVDRQVNRFARLQFA